MFQAVSALSSFRLGKKGAHTLEQLVVDPGRKWLL